MYFDSFEAVLHMDGHGPYVWAAYLITALVVTAILVLPRRRQNHFLKQLGGEIRRQQAAAETPPEEC